MVVWLNVEGGKAETRLDDPDAFDGLKVQVRGATSDAEIAAALGALGVLDANGEDVYLDREELARLAGPKATDEAWRSQFDAMVAYASTKGWVDQEGRIQAHVERERDR
jgi:hypothetical protein